MTASHLTSLRTLPIALSLVVAACGGSETHGPTEPPAEPTDYISGLPYGEGAATPETASGANAADGALTAADPAESGANPARAISEADIIQRDGDTLYALSRYSGLSIIDIADPAKLRMLGRHQSAGEPFEMYIEDGVVIAMYDNYGHYAYDEATQSSMWVQSSHVQAIDVSDPAAPESVGSLDIPGNVADSRRVGDVLYVVSNEYGCWRCSDGPSTVITSLNLTNLAKIREVDQLRFEQDPESWQGVPSIAVTEERVYIGNRNENWNADGSLQKGTIQAVDISDAAGDLVEGAVIQISGQIDNRWQMDEHNGVLRVLSQYSQWQADAPPRLETFSVASAKEITKLGDLEVKLPRPEILQSVRFDGDRAFAITFEQIDPLFTFDLSDPANPVQLGELEIPGWVYHMEPRGDRLYAIGFDNSIENAALHVSLFDVSDLSKPTMLQRVNFGGDWAQFAEDQDRIHKSFKLFDEEGLIVVPFSGWDNDDDNCWGQYASGVQLVDFTADTLELRGVAPQVGEARRAFIHKEHLFGTGDDAVQTFDISDRDKPKKVDTLEVARNITTLRVLGDHVLRFGNDWWTDRAVLDIVPVAQAADPTAGTPIDLSELVQDDRDVCGNDTYQYSYWGNVYTNGNYAYIERHIQRWDGQKNEQEVKFFVLDVSDLEAPAVVGEFSTTIAPKAGKYEYQSGTLMTDSALLVGRVQYQNGGSGTQRYSYDIFDIRDGKAPKFVKNFEVPAAVANFGWGRMAYGCGLDYGWGWGGYGAQEEGSLVSGDIVASSHSEALEDGTARARMFLDRLDVSDPTAPKMLDKLNIPGEAIHYDHASGMLVTIEYDVRVKPLSQDECWEQNRQNQYFRENECRYYERHLNVLNIDGDVALRVAREQVDGIGANKDWFMNSLAVTNERVFVRQYQQRLLRTSPEIEEEYQIENATRVFATDGLEEIGTVKEQPGWSWNTLKARGSRAFVDQHAGELVVYDAADTEQEPSVKAFEVYGWGCQSLEVREGKAFCASGKNGVRAFDLK